MLTLDLAIYFLSFLVIWAGTGLIVSSVDNISKKLGVSTFAISFVLLGILTSVPEFAVGLESISKSQPEIFVGNLIGGIITLFLLVIPTLAIIGKGINLENTISPHGIILCLLVIAAPSLLILDKNVNYGEGLLLILLYGGLFYFIQRKKGVFDRVNTNVLTLKSYSLLDFIKILIGISFVFIASNLIVDKTLLFADVLKVSPYYISLVALSLGTNLPELSIAVRAVASGKKDVAFGDYLGSAAANTFVFGVLTILNSQDVITVNRFLTTLSFIVVGLSLFYYFIRSKNDLSRREGAVLFAIYCIFLAIQIYRIAP